MSITYLVLNPLSLALAGYVVVVMILSALAQPMRLRMVDIAEEMLADTKWSEDERIEINHLIDTCMSFLMGLALPIAVVWVFVENAIGKPVEPSRLSNDSRFHGLSRRYLASIFATNPVAGLLWAPTLGLSILISRLIRSDNPQAAVEQPLLRASDAIPLSLLRAA